MPKSLAIFASLLLAASPLVLPSAVAGDPLKIVVERSTLITSNEASLWTLLDMIERATPGSVVRVASFIFEDDFSTSYAVEKMRERAEKDGVKFQFLLDDIMSEAFLPWINYVSTLKGFEVKRFLPPSQEFKNYLKDDLGIQDVDGFLRGLALQKMDLIKMGLASSQRLLSLKPKIEALDSWEALIQFMNDPEAMREIQALIKFHAHFEVYSRRLHQKLMLVEIKEGLEAIVEGRNWSDEYRLSLSTPIGEKYLKGRSYPFFDASWKAVIVDAESRTRFIGEFDRLWNSDPETALPVVPDFKAPGIEEVENRFQERASTFFVSAPELQNLARLRGSRIPFGKSRHVVTYAQNLFTPSIQQSQITEEWIRSIDSATTKITIISAYFHLTPEILAALTRASERGVAIDAYTNDFDTTDMNMVNIAAYQAYETWAAKLGSRFRLFELKKPIAGRGSLHAKVIHIDRSVLGVGSANTDPRSQNLDANNVTFTKLTTDSMKSAADEFVGRYTTGLSWSLLTSNRVSERLAKWAAEKPKLFQALTCQALISQL